MNGFTLVVDYKINIYDTIKYLVVTCTESASDVLVVEDLDFKSKVFLEILDYHDQERQLDSQGFAGLGWASDIVR
jgi:nucleoid-associated protein YejK